MYDDMRRMAGFDTIAGGTHMKNKLLFTLFLLMLTAPVVTFAFVKDYIDSENYENRVFAERPRLSVQTLPSFPQKFDDWFNDHLPYKNQLVMANTIKNDWIGVGTTAMEYMTGSMVIRGKDNWLFYNAEKQQSFNDYICNNLYEEEELVQIADGYVRLYDKLKEMGIELVVLYAANKEQVYPEYMPSSIVPAGSYSRTDQLVDYIQANTSVPLLYTKDALRKEKEGHQLFYKYDTHWNSLGGFVGGQLLNEHFHGEYVSLKDVSVRPVQTNVSGDLAHMLSMGNVYQDDTEWEISGYKEEVTVNESRDGEDFVFASDAKDSRSLLVYMDSFGYALMGIAKDYANVRFSRNTENFASYCREQHPDAVVIELVERWKDGQEGWCKGLYDLLAGT